MHAGAQIQSENFYIQKEHPPYAQKNTAYLNIPHQVFECRSTNTISIYHSLAQLESNTTFFTSPGTKNGGATHTYIAPYKHDASVCVEKNLKKIPTDPRTHRKLHEKNHRHKEGLPKTSIRTFVRKHRRVTHTYTLHNEVTYVCVMHRVSTRAKLSACVWVCLQLQESETSAGQHATCIVSNSQN